MSMDDNDNDPYGFETKGHIYLTNVYSNDIIQNFNKELKDFFVKNSIYVQLQKNYDVNEDKFFVNNTYTLLTNKQKILYYYSPVINNRGNINRINDIGFIEIVNAEKLFKNLLIYFDIDLIIKLVHKISSKSWKLEHINIEIHNNVTNPNGFHFNEKRMAFIVFLSSTSNVINKCEVSEYILYIINGLLVLMLFELLPLLLLVLLVLSNVI
jgi:hypothetical protein